MPGKKRIFFDASYEAVTESGCWIWVERVNPDGYGQYHSDTTQSRMAHRFSYERVHGRVPEGLCVCHRCDVPCCVNPAHLFVGTHADNRRDSVLKNRNVKGERQGHSKLTAEQAREIITAPKQPGLWAILARKYGVRESTINKIRSKNGNWRHLRDEIQTP